MNEIKIKLSNSALNYINTQAMMCGFMISEYIEKVLTDSVPKETISLDNYVEVLKRDPKFKNLNIDIELTKAQSWILAHPNRKLTKTFFSKWIQRALSFAADTKEILPRTNIDVDKIFDRVIQLASRGLTSLPDSTPEYVKRATRECGGIAAIGRMTSSQLKSLKGKFLTSLMRNYEHQQRNDHGQTGTRT